MYCNGTDGPGATVPSLTVHAGPTKPRWAGRWARAQNLDGAAETRSLPLEVEAAVLRAQLQKSRPDVIIRRIVMLWFNSTLITSSSL
jgi:hypothetical protein